ncbi:MAG: hypothetical protein QXS27_06670 [Candidatus Jordarchaeaceae archaeon]
MEILQKLEQNKINQDIAKLKIATIKPDKDVVPLKELAEKHKVTIEAIRKSIKVDNYTLVGNTLINNETLNKLKQELENLPEKKRSEAAKIFQKKGISEVDPLLDVLGYKTIWSALDPDNVPITKKER